VDEELDEETDFSALHKSKGKRHIE
jgi:hypothetical protein